MARDLGEGTDRERRVQQVSKIAGGEHLVLDLMAETASLAGFLGDRLEVAPPEGKLAVVSREALLRMRGLAGRPQDLADIERLESGDGA